MTDKVLEILNRDEKAKRMNTLFIETAKKEGLTGKAFEEARQTFLAMMIYQNKEALQAMAEEAYYTLRGE